MKNKIQAGNVITLAAPYAVVSGAGLLVGFIFAVACEDAASGAAVESEVVGVFDLAKDSSTFAQGAKVYWDDTAKLLTSTASGNKMIGAAQYDAAGGTPVVAAGFARVRLNGTTVV